MATRNEQREMSRPATTGQGKEDVSIKNQREYHWHATQVCNGEQVWEPQIQRTIIHMLYHCVGIPPSPATAVEEQWMQSLDSGRGGLPIICSPPDNLDRASVHFGGITSRQHKGEGKAFCTYMLEPCLNRPPSQVKKIRPP